MIPVRVNRLIQIAHGRFAQTYLLKLSGLFYKTALPFLG